VPLPGTSIYISLERCEHCGNKIFVTPDAGPQTGERSWSTNHVSACLSFCGHKLMGCRQ
jgi:hypothetical protein